MTDAEKIQKYLKEIETLIKNHCTASDVTFQTWRNNVEILIARKFGQDSLEHKKFNRLTFFNLRDDIDQSTVCRRGLLIAKGMLETYLEDEDGGIERRQLAKPCTKGSKRIFIVHGHDGELKEAVARIIEKQNIEAVILSEKANQGKTIIEKFENYTDVGGAICLFTADDVGSEKNAASTKVRARQNVVFETGYFMGKLGRDHIVLLADEEVEMPSDLSGVVYTNTNNWQFDLLKELKAMGYTIDFNLLF